MRQSRASSGVEEPTALYSQRDKPTRGQRPAWSDDARRSQNPNSFIKDSPRLITPHPYLLAHLYLEVCVKDHRPTTTNASPPCGTLGSLPCLLGARGRSPPPLPTCRPQ